MHLTFSPALGQTTVFKVAPGSSFDAGQAPTIAFRASFGSREEYLQAQVDGVQVELWTDLPAQGRAPGEWGALQFGEKLGKGLEGGLGSAEAFELGMEEDADEGENTDFRFSYDCYILDNNKTKQFK